MKIRSMLYTALAGLGIASAPSAAFAAVVGYYEMCDGAGDPNSATVITQAGHTPVDVATPNAAALAGLDVFWVTNCSNGSYGAEYLANLAAINAAVQSGLTLVVHDRYVSGASTILPGVIGVRNTDTNDSVIDFPLNSPILTGPGGTLNNASLDGGNSSSHGYVATNTMPANSLTLAHRTSPSEAVTFRYPWGAGVVIYSTIPLDYYLGGGSAFATVYAANVVDYAAGSFTSCAAEGYTGAKLTLCRRICEVPPSSTTNNLIILYRAIFRQSPPCL